MNTFGIEIKAVFLGVGENCFEWTVTLTKSKQSYTVPFHMGFGHCKKVRPHAPGAFKVTERALINALRDKPRVHATGPEWVKPTPPTIEDVLYALQSDAQSGGHELFEDFASEFGYDEDSRKAEASWHACRETRGHMRRLLGADFEAFLSQEQD